MSSKKEDFPTQEDHDAHVLLIKPTQFPIVNESQEEKEKIKKPRD
jgi:hypothetical protein